MNLFAKKLYSNLIKNKSCAASKKLVQWYSSNKRIPNHKRTPQTDSAANHLTTHTCKGVSTHQKETAWHCGGYGGSAPPVPIPNTAVKASSADGTAACSVGRVGRRRNAKPFFSIPPPPKTLPSRHCPTTPQLSWLLLQVFV